MKLHDGLYEKIISSEMKQELEADENRGRHQETADIDSAEAAGKLARYTEDVVRSALARIRESGGTLSDQIRLVNRLIGEAENEAERAGESAKDREVAPEGKELLALFDRKNSDFALHDDRTAPRPASSLSKSTLFTGAANEPQLFSELQKEIFSCDRIDFLVSFIKWSGLVRILEDLRAFTGRGGRLRVITTSYMGATDVKAVETLSRLPNTEVRISYDTDRTRLHAKAYIFHRETGFSTAYVGSSNLSNAAISSGLEWNVKVTRPDMGDTMDKIEATFDRYWNDDEFAPYDESQREHLLRALRRESRGDQKAFSIEYRTDVRPYFYQQEILDALRAEREVRGHTRNLIVIPTGTGKTVIAAIDYREMRRREPDRPWRLLFIAHREELLKQALATYRAVLKDADFGELCTGKEKPEHLDDLFMTIQTFNASDFATRTTPDFYDYIVVDEFHHAAADSYQTLLRYYRPRLLLGMTATPERMDGQDILQYFDHRIAAEMRLPEAIDRKLLCPFEYFGVSDETDLRALRWTRGGYDKAQLTSLYTLDAKVAERRADLVVRSVEKYAADLSDVKGLGFCVSVEHAKFMADHFNGCGIPSLALTAKSPESERETAKARLVRGDLRFLFVVDLYNEGVDIPEVNMVLFLRPTESLTIFLQQLGRGLRLAEGKDCLTVLDFIGQASRHYNFEEKFAAILEDSSKSVRQEIQSGFVSVPKGCYIRLEKLAQKAVLDNIRQSFDNRSGLVSRIAEFEDESGQSLSLPAFLRYHRLDPRRLYHTRDAGFSRLAVEAGVRPDFREPAEKMMTKALKKFACADSRRWIRFLTRRLFPILSAGPDAPSHAADTDAFERRFLDFARFLSAEENRMLQMFFVTLTDQTAPAWDDPGALQVFRSLFESPVMTAECRELLEYQYERIDFVDAPSDLGSDFPLDLSCSYTKNQLFAALDVEKPQSIREGVKWLPDQKIDVLLITLNKSEKDFSPTTMYQDYSISDRLFHWQSQSTTSETSPTGQRYIHHRELGSRVILFVREYKEDPVTGIGAPYSFLGTASYVRHEGSRPMSITWRLDHPIPAKYLRKTSRLVVG